MDGQKAMDVISRKIVKRKRSAIFFIGNANFNPASPIKKYVRCPGTKKLAQAVKKRSNCDIVYIDEYNTSQVCGLCFKKFPIYTRKDRYKVCRNCQPKAEAFPATSIRTNAGKRELARLRQERNQPQPEPAEPRLVSKWKQFFQKKRLQPNVQAGDGNVVRKLNIVWHRDVASAKNILYKG